jgi:hypothetical protein
MCGRSWSVRLRQAQSKQSAALVRRPRRRWTQARAGPKVAVEQVGFNRPSGDRCRNKRWGERESVRRSFDTLNPAQPKKCLTKCLNERKWTKITFSCGDLLLKLIEEHAISTQTTWRGRDTAGECGVHGGREDITQLETARNSKWI